MIRRLLLISAIAFSFHTSANAQTRPGRPPNVLIVLIDDMGYRDLTCFGGKRAETTQIDRLAREGRKFGQFYVAAPICSPSRAAMLTGQYPNRHRITSFLETRKSDEERGQADWLPAMTPTLARSLHDAGYYTAHVGKWHLGGARDVGDAPLITAYGFDRSLTTFEGLGERILPTFEPVDGKPARNVPVEMNSKLGGPISWVPRQDISAHLVDRAIDEMKVAEAAGKPFYINLWPDDVHSPFQPPLKLRGDGSRSDLYSGVLKELDNQLGRIFAYLRDKPELRDNTIVLVCSDNGHEPGSGSSGELRGHKGNLYEGGIRSPLIIWYPGAMPKSAIGTSDDASLIGEVDVMPSVLALAGVATPEGRDGIDRSATLVGKAESPRNQPLMWVRPPDRPGPNNSFPDLAMRDGNWKLLVDRDGSHVELFDVIADPTESTNLASREPDRVARMSKAVIAWDRSIPSGPGSAPATKP